MASNLAPKSHKKLREAKTGEAKSGESLVPLSKGSGSGELIRKPVGTAGRSSYVKTNFYPIKLKAGMVYSYLVEFDPEIPPERVEQRRRTLARFGRELDKIFDRLWVFDGTILVSLAKVMESVELKNDQIQITISKRKEISTKNVGLQEVQMIANNLVKGLLRDLKLIQFGRNFYYRRPEPIPGFDLTLYSGFSVAVNPTIVGLQMIVDLTHRVVRTRSVRQVMNEIEERVNDDLQGESEEMIWDTYTRRVMQEIKGSVVLATYNQRIWKIDHVDFEKSADSQFLLKNGESISFREYYGKTYKLKLGDTQAGLLVSLPKNKRSKKAPAYLMPEYCYLTGVTDAMRSDFKLMRQLADRTRLSPSQRVHRVQDLVERIVAAPEVKKKMCKTPIELESKSSNAKSRILGPFDIAFRNSQFTVNDNKSFATPVREAGFITGRSDIPTVSSWAIVTEKQFEVTTRQLGQTILQLSKPQGARIASPAYFVVSSDRRQSQLEAWKQTVGRCIATKPVLILYVVPYGNVTIYSYVKNTSCVINAIASQCVKTDSLKNPKMLRPIAGNIFKQMMAKLNFMLWRIDFKKLIRHPAFVEPTMLVGVDVCHDKKIKGSYGKTQAGSNSTVGFCASYNPDFTSYHSYIAYQDKGEEYVKTSKELMRSSLEMFKSKSKSKMYPKNVIVYRDGVGNSQLETFVQKEIKQYEAAFKELGIEVKLHVEVVQKRVSSRLFLPCSCYAGKGRCPVFRCNGETEYHSPLAGTVVDTDIVSSNFADYYMVPSIAPPGATARPTRLIVVRDDLKLSTDDMQAFCYQLCHLYFNWPGPIRVPAPCMYAHKIAYLFGKHVNGEPHAKMNGSLFYL